jgi:hypothetical protein
MNDAYRSHLADSRLLPAPASARQACDDALSRSTWWRADLAQLPGSPPGTTHAAVFPRHTSRLRSAERKLAGVGGATVVRPEARQSLRCVLTLTPKGERLRAALCANPLNRSWLTRRRPCLKVSYQDLRSGFCFPYSSIRCQNVGSVMADGRGSQARSWGRFSSSS